MSRGLDESVLRRRSSKDLDEVLLRRRSPKDLDEGLLRRSWTNDLGEGGISEGLKSVECIININLHCNFHMCTLEIVVLESILWRVILRCFCVVLVY